MALPELYGSMSGPMVSVLQDALAKHVPGWDTVGHDGEGVFGSATTNAVRDFQSRRGIKVDGIVGPKTWTALGFDPYGFVGEEVVVTGSAPGGSPVTKAAPALAVVGVLGLLWFLSRDR